MSAAAAKLLQSCPTLCDPIDGGPPSSPFPGILKARTLEWIAISLSRTQVWKWKSLDHVWLWPHGYSSWNSLSQNTGVDSLALLQGIFPTKGSNPGLPHCRWILYQLSHKESPRILKWVAYPLSSRSSWPRNWTGVSYIADGFSTNWATKQQQQGLTNGPLAW